MRSSNSAPVATIRAGSAALVALVLLGCPATDSGIDEAERSVTEALGRGDRDAARRAVSGLGDELPRSPEELVEVAALLTRAGESPRALWLLEQGAERHPANFELQLALAGAALRLANPSLTRRSARRVPEDAAQHPRALMLEAQAELGLGDLDAALEVLRRAEAGYPEQPESRFLRITVLTHEKRHEEAIAAIGEALAVVPEGEETARLRRALELTRAQVQLIEGEPELAIESLRARVRTDPTDLQAWQLLVRALVSTGESEQAIALLEAAVRGAATHDLYALLGPLYAAAGRIEEAERALRSFAEHASSAAAVQPLVRYLGARDDAEGAEAAVRSAIERFPGDAILRELHVEALLARDEVGEAEREASVYAGLDGASAAVGEYFRARFELARGRAAAAARRLGMLAPRLDLAKTQYWLGRALEEAGDSGGARSRYQMARQRDPRWPAPMWALVGLAARRGDWNEVALTARALVRMAPGSRDAWLALARALLALERGELLLEASDRAVRAFPEEPAFRLFRSHALRLLGRSEEALAELENPGKALLRDPELAAERAIALALLGRSDEGMTAARAAAQAHPDSARPHAALATLHFLAGDGARGERAVDRALALAPESVAPLLDRCRFRASSGRFDGAVEDCTRYLAGRPDDAEGHYLLGVAHAGTGSHAQAIRAYRRAAELDELDFRARNNLAVTLARRGDLDGALEAGQEAYRLAGGNPWVADTLGDLYLRRGLVERAISILEEAHTAAPEMPEAQLHLGLAYARAGRGREARTLLAGLDESLPEAHPLRPELRDALDATP